MLDIMYKYILKYDFFLIFFFCFDYRDILKYYKIKVYLLEFFLVFFEFIIKYFFLSFFIIIFVEKNKVNDEFLLIL